MIHNFVHGRFAEVLQITGIADVSVSNTGATKIEGSPLEGDLLTIAMLISLLLASSISYYLIERPGRDISRKLFPVRPNAPEPPKVASL